MAKSIIRQEIIRVESKPKVIDTFVYMTEEERKEALKPTVLIKDDYEKKVEAIEKRFEEKKRLIVEEAEREMDRIRKESENEAFRTVKKAVEEYETKLLGTSDICQTIIKKAEIESQSMIEKVIRETEIVADDSQKIGSKKGREEGYIEGTEEVDRLVLRLNNLVSKVVNIRNEIVRQGNQQAILVMLFYARTAIKSIIETQKRVVYDNIVTVLKRLKGRVEIIIRVCNEDLAIVSRHKKEFMQMVEGLEQLRIVEDQSVEQGGCIIDTDFGTIDSRISVQTKNIEDLIYKSLEIWGLDLQSLLTT